MSPALRASEVERNDRGRPPRVMVPPSAVSAPVRILTRVLLPAPLAPINAWISPPRTRRSAPRRATTGPKLLISPLASSRALESATEASSGTAAMSEGGARAYRPRPLADRRRVGDRGALQAFVLQGRELLDELVVVGSHDGNEWLVGRLELVDDCRVDA